MDGRWIMLNQDGSNIEIWNPVNEDDSDSSEDVDVDAELDRLLADLATFQPIERDSQTSDEPQESVVDEFHRLVAEGKLRRVYPT